MIVGPDVTHPWFQHPAVIAANMAHLDELSEGRALLGMGRGSMYNFVRMKDPSTLVGLEEAVTVIQMLLGGDREEFEGEVFGLGPGPGLMFGSRQRLPVHFGTHGKKGMRLAVRIGDGIRVAGQWATGYMEQVRGWVEEAAVEFDRDLSTFELINENWTYLHPDRELARREARRSWSPISCRTSVRCSTSIRLVRMKLRRRGPRACTAIQTPWRVFAMKRSICSWLPAMPMICARAWTVGKRPAFTQFLSPARWDRTRWSRSI